MNERVYWKSNQQHVSEATLTKTKQGKWRHSTVA